MPNAPRTTQERKDKPTYSGPQSVKLWKRIRTTNDLTLYGLFIALQSVEHQALLALHELEKRRTDPEVTR